MLLRQPHLLAALAHRRPEFPEEWHGCKVPRRFPEAK